MAEIPTKEDLAQLPRWAIVAFAARCALRVVGAYRFCEPSSAIEDCNAVWKAANLAADTAGAAKKENSQAAWVAADLVSQSAGSAVSAVNRANHAAAKAAAAAARFAAEAAMKTHSVRISGPKNSTKSIAILAEKAMDQSATVIACIEDNPNNVSTLGFNAAMLDYSRIARSADTELWTNETPVPQSVFGPLWPNGYIPPWEEEPGESPLPHVSFEVFVDPGNSTLKDVQRLFQALSDLHRAEGGNGLLFREPKWRAVVMQES